MALALITASRRLRQYFLAHSIIVHTNQPLKQVLQNLEHSGRLSKWAMELSKFDIEFKPKTTMKGQLVADFIAEMTEREDAPMKTEEAATEFENTVVTTRKPAHHSQWNLYVDDSCYAKASGAGILLTRPGGLELEYALKFNFKPSNNVAE
ncbi:hypothetical protein ACLB2K_043395 [Fragaria x ananassa]